MKLNYFLPLIFILGGCVSAPTPEQQKAESALRHDFHYDANSAQDFFVAIDKDQLQAVKLFIQKWGRYPYVEPNPGYYGDKVNGLAALKAALHHPEMLQYLLQFAGTGPTAKIEIWSEVVNFGFNNQGASGCIEPQSISVLLSSAGAPTKPANVTGTLTSHQCVESLKAFLQKFPTGASSPDGESFSGLRRDVREAATGLNDGDFKRLDEIIAVLSETSDAECRKDSIQGCKAKDEYSSLRSKLNQAHDKYKIDQTADQEQQANAKKERERLVAYKASPQSVFDRACSTTRDVAFFQEQINQEKKIGEESGVVNRASLYQAGQRFAGAKDFLVRIKAEYKKRTGKIFDYSTCVKNQTKKQ